MMKPFYSYVNNNFDKIYIKEYSENSNQPKLYTVEYQPKLYIPTNKESKFKTIHGKSLSEIQFESSKELKTFLKKYDSIQNFEMYGMDNPTSAFIEEHYKGELEFDRSKIRVGFFDIETKISDENGKPTGFPEPKFANNEITAITIYYNNTYYALGTKDWDTPSANTRYFKCASEKKLLLAFISLLENFKLDILCGYNIDFFDTPYLYNRMVKIGLSKEEINRMSPFGVVKSRMVQSKIDEDESTQIVDIFGTSLIDYYVLYKKYSGQTLESYKLDYVASTELNDKKIDYSDYNTLDVLYHENFPLYMEYNIQDVKLLIDIDAKKKLLDLVIVLAYMSKTNYNDIFKQTRIWDQLIYTYLLNKDIVVPYRKPHSIKSEKFAGAYVKEPQIGMHPWAVSFDLTALYPSLIRQYNIGVETIQDEKVDIDLHTIINTGRNIHKEVLKEENFSMAANGTLYDNSKKSFLSELVELMTNKRNEYKKKYLEADKKKNDVYNEIKKRGLKI